MTSIVTQKVGNSIDIIGSWEFDTTNGALQGGQMVFKARPSGSTGSFTTIASVGKSAGDWYADSFGAKINWTPSTLGEWEVRAHVAFSTTNGYFTTSDKVAYASRSGFWHGVSRAMTESPRGNVAAISCHNCYSSGAASNTISKIHQAQSAGADLIELDLVRNSSNIVHVQHDNGTITGPRLIDVLADTAFRNGDQILYLEIKTESSDSSESYLEAILDDILAYGTDYINSGRPVVLRTFQNRIANLQHAQAVLEKPAYASISPYVKLSVLYGRTQSSSTIGFQSLIDAAKSGGLHGVEFERQTKNLYSLIKYSRSQNLGINLYTFNGCAEEVNLAALREEVDAFTVERFCNTKFPSILEARQIVNESSDLLYLNASTLYSNQSEFLYNETGTSTFQATSDSKPIYVGNSKGSAFYGFTADFAAVSEEYLRTYDADNSSNCGFLAASVVRFKDLSLADGETNSFLTKADAAGFTLELYNPSGSAPSVLRFGVNVDGSYHYATYPVSLLNTNESYIVSGAYDGNGGIWMFVNNNHSSVTNGSASGGVKLNNTKVLLGADPSGNSNQRFYSSVEIQMCSVLNWCEGHTL